MPVGACETPQVDVAGSHTQLWAHCRWHWGASKRTWNSPIGLPNCLRSCTYGSTVSMQACGAGRPCKVPSGKPPCSDDAGWKEADSWP